MTNNADEQVNESSSVALDVLPKNSEDQQKRVVTPLTPTEQPGSLRREAEDSDEAEKHFDFDAHIEAIMEEIPDSHKTQIDRGISGGEGLSGMAALGTSRDIPHVEEVLESNSTETGGPGASQAFDLDSMLTAAIVQATQEVTMGEQPSSVAPSVLSILPPSFTPTALQTSKSDSTNKDEIDDEDGDEPIFDLDAHLQAAMLRNATSTPDPDSEMRHTSDVAEAASDKGEGFDLDAQIGAAMGSLLPSLEGVVTETPAAAAQAFKVSSAGGITADDLQAMLQGAMQQATKELELDDDDYAENDYMEFDEDEEYGDAETSERPFSLPDKPKTRPCVEDDGNPENAFNTSRPYHYQALPYAFACSFPQCDQVVSLLLRSRPRQTR